MYVCMVFVVVEGFEEFQQVVVKRNLSCQALVCTVQHVEPFSLQCRLTV